MNLDLLDMRDQIMEDIYGMSSVDQVMDFMIELLELCISGGYGIHYKELNKA
jgi:hypothetical protein